MGALIGLLFASGVLFVMVALADKPDDRRHVGPKRGTSPISGVTCKTAFSAVLIGLAMSVLTGLAAVGVICSLAAFRAPAMRRARKKRQLGAQRRAAWPEVIDSLVSAVRAGLSLPEAVCAIAERGPMCVRDDFSRFAMDYRSAGRFEGSVMRLRDELADPVADRILEALLAAREVGGSDLGNMLRSLAEFVRQDLRLRGEVEARQSWTVNGARLAVLAPWLVLLMLSTRPGTVAAYASFGGSMVLFIAAATSVAAYQLMVCIGRLPHERRIVA